MGHFVKTPGSQHFDTFPTTLGNSNMPQVANAEETFAQALSRLMEERGLAIRGFAKLLAKQKRTSVDGERKSIRRHLDGDHASESVVDAYEKALKVKPGTLPDPPPRQSPTRRLNEMEERLARLERREVAGGHLSTQEQVDSTQDELDEPPHQPDELEAI